jgi:uncharacterized protein YciW
MAGTVDRGTSMDHSHLLEKESDARIKFERACQQIALLDQKIRDLEVRYKRAVKFKKNSFRYNLRLRLSVVTGVKMMYHHYASTKAEELTKIRRQINDANAVPSTNSTPVFTPREGSSFRAVDEIQRSAAAGDPGHHC